MNPAASVCIERNHRVIHRSGDIYYCYDCTLGVTVKDSQNSSVNELYIVTPLPAWKEHNHIWGGWEGFDGNSNYYTCKICKVDSYDHDGWDAQQKANAP